MAGSDKTNDVAVAGTSRDVYLYAGITGDFSPNHVDRAKVSCTDQSGELVAAAENVCVLIG